MMQDNISANRRIAKNAVFLYLRMAIIMVVNLYTTRIILQNLGANDYGIYNVVYGFVAMFTVFNVTLTAGINRYYNFELGKFGLEGVCRVFNVAIRVQIFFAAIVFFVVEILGLWYINCNMVMEPGRLMSANWVFQFSVVSMLFLIIQNPFSSAVIAFERMGFFSAVSVADVFFKLGIAVMIAYSPIDSLVFFGGLMSLITIIDFCAYYLYCKKSFSDCITLTKSYDRNTFNDMLKFSGWMSLDPIAYSIKGQGVNMLINSFFGTIVNTAFGIANQVGIAIDSFCMNLSTAFRPQMVQSYSSGNKYRSIVLFISMSKIGFFLFLLICIPLVFNIKYIYDIWLGDTYPPITIFISVLFVFVKLVGCINHPISYLIMAKGNLKNYMIVTCIISSSILPIAFVLLKIGLSVELVFITMLIIAIINQIASINVLSKEIPEIPQSSYYSKVFFPCFSLLVIVSGMVYLSHRVFPYGLSSLSMDVIVSLLSTILASYFIGLNSSEKMLFISLVGKVFEKNDGKKNIK